MGQFWLGATVATIGSTAGTLIAQLWLLPLCRRRGYWPYR